MSETKVYLDDVGTGLIVNTGVDIAAAVGTKLFIRKPDRTEVEWTPAVIHTIDTLPNYLKYITVAGDLNLIGTYKVQAGLTLGPWTGRGETASFTVTSKFC